MRPAGVRALRGSGERSSARKDVEDRYRSEGRQADCRCVGAVFLDHCASVIGPGAYENAPGPRPLPAARERTATSGPLPGRGADSWGSRRIGPARGTRGSGSGCACCANRKTDHSRRLTARASSHYHSGNVGRSLMSTRTTAPERRWRWAALANRAMNAATELSVQRCSETKLMK